jgi:F-type H+-transporting ATPase subunit a
MLQHEVQHAAAPAAEKFDAGKVIIEHVSNTPLDHPLIHLPPVFGIDFSVTKHVFMLWLVAAVVFLLVTWAVRRYLREDRLVPSGFMNALEAMVEFVRDQMVEPNVGRKWVMVWTPLVLTLFVFILAANLVGLIPIFEVVGVIDRTVLHLPHESFIAKLLHAERRRPRTST